MIEVIAATALLSTLLIGIVVSHARHKRMILRDQRRALAINAADALVSSWMQHGTMIPSSIEGAMHSDLGWYTETISREGVMGLRFNILKLHIVDELNGDVLLQVDLATPSRTY